VYTNASKNKKHIKKKNTPNSQFSALSTKKKKKESQDKKLPSGTPPPPLFSFYFIFKKSLHILK
jgi:hypothetical protein